jgi:calcium channel MID1
MIGDNCKIITNLEFCNETQYAVPANDTRFNITELANFYDNYARTMYGNFQKSLMQIPCEAPSVARYSLVKNCTDCEAAYKRWLCSVTIPRCEDFSTDNRFAIPRNINSTFANGTRVPDNVATQFAAPAFQMSRNRRIDAEVSPGPYKEILPCEDLCYELVQSCPAALGFSCPQPQSLNFDKSYGRKDGSGISCNYPGEPRRRSASSSLRLSGALLCGITAVAALVVML